MTTYTYNECSATAGENPFATRFTQPDALSYRSPEGEDAALVVRRLESAGWRGQIVGPHGSGKSTLMRSLASEIQKRGREPVFINIRRDGIGATRSRVQSIADSGNVLLLEGFEVIPPRGQRRLLSSIASKQCGSVATVHSELERLAPVVADTRPTIALARSLFADLTAAHATPVTTDDLDHAFATCNGNLRDVWLDLYLLHERLVHNRTAPVRVAYTP